MDKKLNIVMWTLIAIIMVLLFSLSVSADTTVCVKAFEVPSVDADGFPVDVTKAQKEINDSTKDLTKQIKKSKHLELSCDNPTFTLTVFFRGWLADGSDFNVRTLNFGIYTHVDIKEQGWRTLKVQLDYQGKTKILTEQVTGDMGNPMSWGGCAKSIKKKVEKFAEAIR